MSILPERGKQPALTRALLGWLLAPLFFLLAVSAYTTYRNAYHLAETERDLVLEEIADDMGELVSAALENNRKIDPDSLAFSLLIRDARHLRRQGHPACRGSSPDPHEGRPWQQQTRGIRQSLAGRQEIETSRIGGRPGRPSGFRDPDRGNHGQA
jgi:hypothetical protein